jgi:hypothetical protein
MAKQNYGGAYDSDRSIDWNLGDVSEGGGCGDGPLHTDDGGPRNVGAVGADHAVDKEHGGYNKGSGFSAPKDDAGADWGPADFATADHLDDGSVRLEWNPESEATAAHGKGNWTDQPLNASPSRIKKVSAFETYTEKDGEGRWYGSPDGERQE